MSRRLPTWNVLNMAKAVFCALLLAAATAVPALDAGAQCYTTESIDLDPGDVLGMHSVLTGFNTVTKKLYTLSENGVLSIYNGTTDAFIDSFVVGSGSFTDIAVDEGADKVYITDDIENTLIVIDGATNSLAQLMETGFATPQRIAVHQTSGRVYVTNADSASVTVILGATNTLEASVDVGIRPMGIGINGTDIYVANDVSGDVSVIDGDPVSGSFHDVVATIDTMPFPGAEWWNPTEVAVNEGTNMVYVLNAGGSGTVTVPASVAVINGGTRALADLSPAANPVPVPGVYWSNGIRVRESVNAVIVLDNEDVNGNPLHTFSVMSGVTHAFAVTGPNQNLGGPITATARSEILKRAYYLADGAVHVVDIDGTSGTFLDVIAQMPFGTDAGHPRAMSIDEAAGLLYVAGGETNTTVVLDLSDNSFRSALFPGGGPRELAVDSRRSALWVSHHGGGLDGRLGLRRVDGATGAVTPLETGVFTGGRVRINDVTNWVYTFDFDNAEMIPVNGATHALSPGIPLGNGPHGGAINKTTNRMYLSSGGSNRLQVVDADPASPTFHTALASIPVCGNPEGVAVNEKDNYVYVGCNDGHVAAVNGATNTMVASIPTAEWSDQIAINGTTRRAYVSSDDLGSPAAVRVIDVDPASAAFNTVISVIPIASKSEFIAVNEATDRVYVNIDHNSTVGVIDGAAAAVEAIIPIPGSAEMMFAVDEDLGRVYASDWANSKVHVFDANPASPTFNTLLESVDTGWFPLSAGIDEATHKVFTPNYADNTVSVIEPDLATAEFNARTGVLTIPEVTVGTRTFAVQLTKRAGAFVFDMLPARKTARACPLASYDFATGVLDLPAVKVGKKTFSVQLTKRPGPDFVFDLTSQRKW